MLNRRTSKDDENPGSLIFTTVHRRAAFVFTFVFLISSRPIVLASLPLTLTLTWSAIHACCGIVIAAAAAAAVCSHIIMRSSLSSTQSTLSLSWGRDVNDDIVVIGLDGCWSPPSRG